MPSRLEPATLLADEARALLLRLGRLRPFALLETMVPAAAVTVAAQAAVEDRLLTGRATLRKMVEGFLRWLERGPGRFAPADTMQRRFTYVRLRFNAVLSEFDIFADVMTQRSESPIGVWLAGLDAVAADALRIQDPPYEPPPVMCYLDRGAGAAIRRVRTRLPGGAPNPVAVIRVPRERMISSGVASSLVHEVGHQGSALLGLVELLRPRLERLQVHDQSRVPVWRLWSRWISEILADLWSVARVGVAAPLGLLGVVSLPRVFVFRGGMEDPHPIPWIRVRLSCALGAALYPHRQWGAIARTWSGLYPTRGVDPDQVQVLRALDSTMPRLVALVLEARPDSLRGRTVRQALASPSRRPDRLAALFTSWRGSCERAARAPPTLALAAIGQARADGRLSPQNESQLLARCLTRWALEDALRTSSRCARRVG